MAKIAIVLSLVSAGLALTCAWDGPVRLAELWSYDRRMELHRAPADPHIVLVDIDDAALESVGAWPWPRSLHARLIDRLTRAGASRIGVDVLFAEPSGSAKDDRALADAIARSGHVVLAAQQASGVADGTGTEVVVPPMASLVAPYGLSQFVPDPDQEVRGASSLRILGMPAFAALLSGTVVEDGPALIRFAGPPGTYRTVRASLLLDDLLDPRVDRAFVQGGVRSYEELFKGATVILGSSAPSLHDCFAAPFARRQLMSGSEIHANLLDTLWRGDALTESVGPSIAVTIVLPMLVGLAMAFLPLVPAIGASLGVTGGYVVLSMMLFEGAGTWLWLAAPLSGVASALVALGAWRFWRLSREKRRIRETFSRYVSPRIVEQILRHPERYESAVAERRHVTVLFSDVEGFTSLSESTPEETVARLLNRYLAAMTAIVTEADGTLDKYIGDGLMAVWGNLGPCHPEEDALRAVQAAIDMQRVADDLRVAWTAEGLPPLKVRIGLHSGDGLVGTFGSPQKMDFTVIGDVVNTAARLEALNKEHGTRILMSQTTHALVGGRIPSRPLGETAIRGKTERLDVYTVTAVEAIATQKGTPHA